MNEVEIIQAEALDAANVIGNALAGYSTPASYAALSMVIGYAASQAERPDFDGLFEIIKRGAREEFDRRTQKTAPTREG